MKKLIIVAVVALMLPAVANAQLGGVLEKAARKTVNKLIDKASNSAAERANKAIDAEIDKQLDEDGRPVKSAEEGTVTCESLMRQMPELPTADQLVKHKEAELGGKTLKLVASKVTAFNAKVLELSSRLSIVGYESMDSAQISESAYRYAELTTGMSREELEKLSAMSEDEQEAYIKQRYESGQFQAEAAKHTLETGEWLESLQPLIEQWSAAGDKADKAYEEMNAELRPIYKKYADKLSKATSAERNNILLSYYTEALPYISAAVQKALAIRLDEQLPVAEKIEAEMVNIRAEHPDAISQLLNYPKLTATQYFAEVSRLLEIPEFSN